MVDVKSSLLNAAQLIAGWVGLALSTAGLALFPDFEVISAELCSADRRLGRSGSVDRRTRSVPRLSRLFSRRPSHQA